ncbi:SpoU class rRNA methylase [Mycoplasmoides gallisepticum str. R(low)]|uniref:Putative tRNA (cytidine(34)-2'-O)-methyltransferase n=2 Tax=Mycoplasmoides gallisepticum TaxID=2096 RepID=Q7NBG1_MYCGA|nr:tRNA (cytidine(34)-2'-O)-methyltransferase [Mycoplasmoides gallisepticum]AAP56668.2 SpoU class rRNA methylase [Mycoplasmoides gallisepticum str. R(low)]ADC30515.1 SpoU class rRNA methylase [Mycoplasmoides gallisepticum str. R(high)]SYV94400.1 SpoU class rRNA methylase [Mycoplasmoides gallisepticum]
MSSKINVVLYRPQDPRNAGNIARSCVGFNATLHLIHPFGFFITDERFKRAGLDYWDHLNLKQYADFDDFIKQNQIDENLFLFTKKANNYLSNIDFKEYLDHDQRIYLVFGQETNGLPDQLLNKYQDNLVKIPMHNAIRSFNLANSVICALYELSRQNQFKNVK